MAFNASLRDYQFNKEEKTQSSALWSHLITEKVTYIFVVEFDESESTRFTFKYTGFTKHEIEFGNVAEFLKDLEKGIFVYCWMEITDVETVGFTCCR